MLIKAVFGNYFLGESVVLYEEVNVFFHVL